MKIRNRLILLLGCLLAAFGLSVASLQMAHRQEARTIRASLQAERSELLDRLLVLTGQSFHNFVSDYALWDEMVKFVQTADPAWAAVNVEASLINFNVHAAWILRPDGTRVYCSAQPGMIVPELPLLGDPAFLERLRRDKRLHFFEATPRGLLELRTAPILPSDDIRQEQAPRGWLIAARLWDQTHVDELSHAMQSRITLDQIPSLEDSAPHIHLARILSDWRRNPLRTLHVHYESRSLQRLLEGNKEEAYLLYLFGFIVISLAVVGVSRWVIRPLNLLSQSLDSGRSDAIRLLQDKTDEFGHLARQVTQSFIQRDALRDSEERLRQSMDLRSRLARDLHDGIIQSIYAAGLGLESVRTLPPDDPAVGPRLAACQQMLNNTLWQVRSFIETLEPETEAVHSPGQSLAALAASMQKLQAIPIMADLDPALTGRIGPHQELHLLQMARELLSNALRHSGAQEVRLALQALPEGRAELVISDNGRGFDPALSNGGGRGLINLASRARDFGADLRIESAPGKGARITVQFSPMP